MDTNKGSLYKYQRYVIAILLGCVLAMFYVTTCFHALDRGKISSMNFTLGDMLLYFFRGKEIYNPINGAEFMIPTEYMMLQFFLYDRGLHFKRLTGGWKKYSRADTEKSILVAE